MEDHMGGEGAGGFGGNGGKEGRASEFDMGWEATQACFVRSASISVRRLC